MRRSTYTDQAVTYAAVGATQAEDLIKYPPAGHRPGERSVRLGSGDERFRAASEVLMTWGVQHGSDVEVVHMHAPGLQYTGTSFTDRTVSENQANSTKEAIFAADGTPYLTNGMTAVLIFSLGSLRFDIPVRVVYVIDEPHRIGFAYGTLADNYISGEDAFIVHKNEDGSVWLTVRTFSRIDRWYLRVVSPFIRYIQSRYMSRYLQSLLPGRGA
jgi:uncharacterized protein (UPF0548 family)